MNNSDRKRFGELITDVLAYYRQDTTPFVLNLWWQACENFEFEQVAKALNTHALDPERGQFAPKVADLVRILSGTHTDRSLLAWGKVLKAMSDVGAYQDVVFDDPAIHAAVADCGGWTKICRTDMAELGYLQHRFCATHKACTVRGQFDYPRILGGERSPDSEYHRRGLPVPSPAVVGDREKARLVYRGGETLHNKVTYQPLDVLAIPVAKS